MVTNLKVAVVDDDQEMGRVVSDLLGDEGYQISQYLSASEALAKFKTDPPHILITDHRMRDIDGLMFLRKVQTDYPAVVSIMMTAFGSIETAIEAMKAGAYHYIVKPFKNEELSLLVKRAAERILLKDENASLKKELQKTFTLDSMIGKSAAISAVFELIKVVATANANVLITGESGSGKELVARALHNSSSRKNKAFVPINCTALPEQLLESELFGHVRGSFTGAVSDKKGLFEEANGGTLFLDEIGDMSLQLQAKLLRVLQDRQIRPVGGNTLKNIDVRIVAATHRDLKIMVKDGKFREDLFYRLNVVPIRVPPLRERKEDIPLLVESFIKKFSIRNESKVQSVRPDAMSVLMAHPWPGNVRELENVIERAIVLTPGEIIEKKVVLGSALEEAQQNIEQLQADRPTLEKLEERYIKMIMQETDNRKDEAARVLGISRRTLYRKERIYGMVSDDTPEPLEDPNENFG
ncbi:MAG: sigma-54 dependent transcriptional regulator [Bdellovibrionales bacterium]|nr:sigma-54 dependent transcriptional regulator [Bdellovibrionales bacterium]